MTFRHRPALALALATAAVTTAPTPAVADEPTEPEAQHCFTEALTAEEVEDGVLSEIECFDASEAPAGRGSLPTLAIIYDVSYLTGDFLTVSGSSCTGAYLNLTASDPWNNRASATTLDTCGNAKHFTGANFTGTNELKQGKGYHTFTGAMNNSISSIEYAP